MKVGSRRVFVGAAVLAFVALLGTAISARQAAPAQGAGEPVPTSDNTLKNVQLLKGIPIDTFFESMGMFANALGVDCTFCHDSNAYFDKSAFANPTPRIMRARQMIVMMNALNKQYFGGQPRVTCFTCHQGTMQPRDEPNLALQYGEPVEDPNSRNFPAFTGVTAEQVLDKYLQALGGADRVAKFTSYTAKGTYEGFDTAFDKRPVEIAGRAPAQQTMLVHMSNGDSVRTFDGQSGWWAGPDTPIPLLTLTAGNLEGARLDALIAFPAGIKQAYSQWKVGRTDIEGREVRIVQGLRDGQPQANFYFDSTGLVVRVVRWARTPVGFVPTQVDYSDYRDVAGVKVPFKRTVSQTYMQMTVEFTDVQPNVQVPASRFAKPTPWETKRMG
ncbi:MAG: hypothetical protein A3F70_07085 [Acidobacteria bacterium RIFCSPLOWO2_12_FULL_67_14]|nr:MAG: hypothetical protein A3F70_07085 [Acidobacteria bacterium RIFCSPLOWO2_12_FULL_67_14]